MAISYHRMDDSQFYNLRPRVKDDGLVKYHDKAEIDEFFIVLYSEGKPEDEIIQLGKSYFGAKIGPIWLKEWRKRQGDTLSQYILKANQAAFLKNQDVLRQGAIYILIEAEKCIGEMYETVRSMAKTPQDFERAARIVALKVKTIKPILDMTLMKDKPMVNIELNVKEDDELVKMVDMMWEKEQGNPVDNLGDKLVSVTK